MSKQSTLLPNLDWHISRPFERMVEEYAPKSQYKEKIEDYLLNLWVDEQYDFKVTKNTKLYTVYDEQIEIWKVTKKQVEDKKKHEEDTFQKLYQQFEALDAPEVEDEAVDEAEEEDDDTSTVRKTSKESARTIQEKARREAMRRQTVKANMAASQQRLIDLQKELDTLEEQTNAFLKFQQINRYILQTLRSLVLAYETTKNRKALVEGIEDLVNTEEKRFREGVSKEYCSGTVKDLCQKHHMPLQANRYSIKGEVEDARCRLYPVC